MNRRAFVARSLAATGFALAGCARRSVVTAGPWPPSLSLSNNACELPPVNVRADRETRTVVGLRPFRPSGFVVRAEKIGDTLVIHNYGHGGGGITLSWGTSRLAVDLARGVAGPAAVLGCGAVGLSCAMLLREAGYDVTLYARELPPQTTSNIAGGQWYPAMVSDADRRTQQFNDQFAEAARFAYQRYQILLGKKFGVRWMRNYQVQNEPFTGGGYRSPGGALHDLMPEMCELEPGEHPFTGYQHVLQYDSLIIEPPIYLAAMVDELRIAGVTIQVRELHSREELQALPQKLVFNCTGLGARDLFGDSELIPMKGQLTFLLPQPEVEYAAMWDDYYMFSRTDGVLLGGTHVRGDWSLEPDLAAKARILEAHRQMFSSFRACRPAPIAGTSA